MKYKKIICVVGARPNLVKFQPIFLEFKKKKIKFDLVHTGQHYSKKLSYINFKALNIPPPKISFNTRSKNSARQFSKILINFDQYLKKNNTDLVILFGDVNSTLACALSAAKLNIDIAHIEAGLRSFDKTMPEEINRVLTDHVSKYLFVTEKSAIKNLNNENIKKNIFFVGNVMIDTLLNNKEYINKKIILYKNYIYITIHRKENLININNLEKIIDMILKIKMNYNIVLNLHPNTKLILKKLNLIKRLNGINIIPPQDYISNISYQKNSLLVISDSGGMQEECAYLNKPIIILRKNTERPVVLKYGNAEIVDVNDLAKIQYKISKLLRKKNKKKKIPMWDGKTAQRIVEILEN